MKPLLSIACVSVFFACVSGCSGDTAPSIDKFREVINARCKEQSKVTETPVVIVTAEYVLKDCSIEKTDDSEYPYKGTAVIIGTVSSRPGVDAVYTKIFQPTTEEQVWKYRFVDNSWQSSEE